MNQQSYLYTSDSFNKALDEFQDAVLSGNQGRIRMAREKVKELAPAQAIEYDHEMRCGLIHYYRRWQRGEDSETQFKNNFTAALNAGLPNSGQEGLFEHAFPHLNVTPTKHAGLRFAVFNTERLWNIHQRMRELKVEEKLGQ